VNRVGWFNPGEIVAFMALRERAGLPISTAMRDAKMKYDNFTEELLLSFAMYVYAPTSLRYRNATADSMPLPGNSILDLAKASTSGAQQNCLCQTPLTSLSIIINLLRFGLETAELRYPPLN
jgi:hypothetical protein